MKNISLIGPMGSGKSTIGALLASKIDLDFIDLDEQIELKTGQKISEIFEQKGEDFFRTKESEVLQEFSNKSGQVISTGGGAVQNEQNLKTLKESSTTIYLKTSPEVLFERIKEDTSRPLLQTEKPFETICELLEKRAANYEKADIIVVTDGKTTEEIVEEIIKNVKS